MWRFTLLLIGCPSPGPATPDVDVATGAETSASSGAPGGAPAAPPAEGQPPPNAGAPQDPAAAGQPPGGAVAPPTDGAQAGGSGGAPLPDGKFQAANGSLFTDKLLEGMVALDTSSEPLTPIQARAVLAILDQLDDKIRKNQYYDQELEVACTAAQLAVMDTMVGMNQNEMRAKVNPERMEAVLAGLESVAGVPRPTSAMPVPDDLPLTQSAHTVTRMTTFIAAWDTLSTRQETQVDRAQARKLLPLVDGYVRLKSDKHATKDELLAILTTTQKAWIDANPSVDESFRDMTRLTATLRTSLRAKLQ